MDNTNKNDADELDALRTKVNRLEKINEVLMRRVEESVNKGGEAHFLFQNAITLERKVKERTASLEATREKLEASNEALLKAKDTAEIATIAKSKFLANMSHEIRTPMNGMLGILQLVLEGELHEELRTDLNTVYSSAHSLLALLNDILDFSKAEAERIELEDVDFDLASLIEDCLELFAEAAAKKHLFLYSDIDPSVSTCTHGDPARLRQVINNLLGNAIKFTETGGVVVNVRRTTIASQDAIKIEVVDTGIGLNEQQCAQLFQPFTQADASTTRKYGGTGLGLAICRQIISRMGGNIDIESTANVGSNFWFDIPLSMRDCSQCAACDKFSGKKIAVLDVHAGHANASANKLQKLGCLANWFVIDSMEDFHKHKIEFSAQDALLVDSSLFDLLTPQLLAQSHNTFPPIVPVMAHREHISHCEAFGAPLFKPVRRRELERVLGKLFEKPKEKQASLVSTMTAKTQFHSAKILVVDDNEVNQMVAERSLNKLGFRADVLSDGKQALEAHKANAYDLIFMDCQMPIMDGYEASTLIRQLEGSAKLVPIIAVTANVMDGDKQKCLEAGMSDYLAKPIKLEQLKALMQDWISEP